MGEICMIAAVSGSLISDDFNRVDASGCLIELKSWLKLTGLEPLRDLFLAR